MNTKNEKAVVTDKELEKVSGGEITVNDFSAEMTCKASADAEHFNDITIGDISGTITSKAKAGEKKSPMHIKSVSSLDFPVSRNNRKEF